ncbi:hypothetical protein DRN69_03625 [Candidatus Pacearchaeota archaeon]|nr:MAG: hypothetical protein DRN69_03625 [Candidatus Pacearchaeota archaeon]
MGLFKKKEKKIEEAKSLPDLPKLPELPEIEGKKSKSIHQLPRFPNDSLGEKFSQNTIKEAVTGEKEDDELGGFADEIAEDEMQMMHKPQIRELPDQESYNQKKVIRTIPRADEEFKNKSQENEPVFIRIDRFEEALNSFEKAKKQILSIENLLRNIKKTREDEAKELESWEREIKNAKAQIENIDKSIFSKIENEQ